MNKENKIIYKNVVGIVTNMYPLDDYGTIMALNDKSWSNSKFSFLYLGAPIKYLKRYDIVSFDIRTKHIYETSSNYTNYIATNIKKKLDYGKILGK